jgi:hypothetical protein
LLVLKAVPAQELDKEVEALAQRIGSVPQNQLTMQKLMRNGGAREYGSAVDPDDGHTVRRHRPPYARRAQLQASRRRRRLEAGGGGA